MTNAAESDTSPGKKIRDLEKENRKLRKKIKGLKKTMDITSRHGDIVAEELEEKVEASEVSSPNPATTPDNGGRKSKK